MKVQQTEHPRTQTGGTSTALARRGSPSRSRPCALGGVRRLCGHHRHQSQRIGQRQRERLFGRPRQRARERVRQQPGLLRGERVRRRLQDDRRRGQLVAPQRPPAGDGLGRRGRSEQRQPGLRDVVVRRARRPARRHQGQHRRRRDLDAAGTSADTARGGHTLLDSAAQRTRAVGVRHLRSARRGEQRLRRDELRAGAQHRQRRDLDLRRPDAGAPPRATSGTSSCRRGGIDRRLRRRRPPALDRRRREPGPAERARHPAGRCSIAVSPDEAYVLFVVASRQQRLRVRRRGRELDEPREPRSAQGRIPFVVTNQRADTRREQQVRLWYGDVQLFRADCTTPATPGTRRPARCPLSGTRAGTEPADRRALGRRRPALRHRGRGRRLPGALLLGRRGPPQHGGDSPGCQSPTWARSNVGFHGLCCGRWTAQTGPATRTRTCSSGCRTTAPSRRTNAAPRPPTWTNPNCCDTFDVLADPTWDAGHVLLLQQRAGSTGSSAPARATPGAAEINTVPGAGNIATVHVGPPARAIRHRRRGDRSCTDGIFVTDEHQGQPDRLDRSLAAVPGGAGGPAASRPRSAAARRRSSSRPAVHRPWRTTRSSRYDGIGTTRHLDADRQQRRPRRAASGSSPSTRTTRTDLYASNLGARPAPQMVFSTDGGTNWTTRSRARHADDRERRRSSTRTRAGLDEQRRRGRLPGLPAADPARVRPEDGEHHRRGRRRLGRVPVSVDGGANWSLVTEPVTPSSQAAPAAAAVRVLRPRAGRARLSIYVGTQGRGVWRLALPAADGRRRRAVHDATRAPTSTLDAAGSTDPDGRPAHLRLGLRQRRPVRRRHRRRTRRSTLVGQDGVFPVSVKVTDPDGGVRHRLDDGDRHQRARRASRTSTSDGPKPENTAITVTGVI